MLKLHDFCNRAVEDIFTDPHFQARGMLAEVPDAELGSLVLPGIVPKLSASPGQLRHTGGAIGQDTREILLEHTSLDLEEILALEAQGVIQQGPAAHTGPA